MSDRQQSTTTSIASAPPAWTGVRRAPSVKLGLLVYAGYLAIFYSVWAINDVDYPTIGDTVESTKLHYAAPTLFASAFLLIAITALGWWRITLFDKVRSGPKWALIGPITMFLLACCSYATVNWDKATSSLILWSALGAIGVGFGEEMITRGALLVGLRTNHPEDKVWLYSTLAFAALHGPNALFGESVPSTVAQVVLTFMFGSLLWATRRLTGSLLPCMFLHGFWDSAVFLPDATGTKAFPLMVIVYPVAIVVTIAVLRRNKNLFVR